MYQLSEEELSQTIARASEIVAQHTDSVSAANPPQQVEAYLSAAEEVGIPRHAMLQAMRERSLVPLDSIKPGDVVFAPSVDKALYAATVVQIESDSSILVQFLKGGERSVAAADIRPLGLVPGRTVQFDSNVADSGMSGLWYTGKILEYNAQTQKAQISYGFEPYSAPLSKLRLKAEQATVPPMPPRVRDLLIRAVLIAGGVGTGIGFLLGHLLR